MSILFYSYSLLQYILYCYQPNVLKCFTIVSVSLIKIISNKIIYFVGKVPGVTITPRVAYVCLAMFKIPINCYYI